METGVRIELTYNSFAESGLTTWLTRHKLKLLWFPTWRHAQLSLFGSAANYTCIRRYTANGGVEGTRTPDGLLINWLRASTFRY